MATYSEVKGSRREVEKDKLRYGYLLAVATTAADAGIPTRGDFFTDSAGSTDSGVTGRKCVDVQKDSEALPGIWLIRCTYVAFRAYS